MQDKMAAGDDAHAEDAHATDASAQPPRVQQATAGDNAQGLRYDLTPVSLPYETLEFVFNQKECWANIQHPDPGKISFDFNQSDG